MLAGLVECTCPTERRGREGERGASGLGPDHGGLEAIHLDSIQWETRRLWRILSKAVTRSD